MNLLNNISLAEIEKEVYSTDELLEELKDNDAALKLRCRAIVEKQMSKGEMYRNSWNYYFKIQAA